jgi:hypothetical protein
MCYHEEVRTYALLLLTVWITGCASAPYMLPEPEGGDTDPPMTFRKAMPDHRSDKPWDFYYKHCAMTGDSEYFSATSYDCTGPSY